MSNAPLTRLIGIFYALYTYRLLGLERLYNAQNDQQKNPHGTGSNPVKFKKDINYFLILFFIH